jgi:hypothetical protein
MTIAHREREHSPLYDVKQVQAAEVSQRRTAVSSKCFSVILYMLRQAVCHRAPLLLFPSLSPLTVTFPKLLVILRPL